MQFYQFMPKTLLTFLFLFFTSIIFAQVNTLRDALVLKIPQANTYTTTGISDYIKQNFSTDTDRIRAIYVWITNNIVYDVVKLQARNQNVPGARQTVDNVLKTRLAVCQGYAVGNVWSKIIVRTLGQIKCM